MWPTKNRRQDLTLSVPALDGGVNYERSPQLIDNDELCDAVNVVYKDGALRRRKGLQFMEQYHLYTDDQQISQYQNRRYSVYNNGSFAGIGFNDVSDPMYQGESAAWFYFTEDLNGQVQGETAYQFGTGFSGGLLFPYKNYNVFIGETSGRKDPVVLGLGGERPDFFYPLMLMNGKGTDQPNRTVNGITFEGKNLLSQRFRAQFTTDGVGKFFWLPLMDLDSWTGTKVSYTGNDGTTLNWSLTQVEYYGGSVAHLASPAAVGGYWAILNTVTGALVFSPSNNPGIATALPASAVSNNVEITASKSTSGESHKITGCSVAKWYGGSANGNGGGTRLFVSGNPDYPGRVWWSDVGNPCYFPENNWADVGDGNDVVTALGQQGSLLIVFCRSSTYALGYASNDISTEQLMTGAVIDVTTQSASMYIFPISDNVGCDLPNTVCTVENRLLWATLNGNVYALSGTVQRDQRNITNISAAISSRIKPNINATATAASDSGSYMLYCGGFAWYFDATKNAWWPLKFDSDLELELYGVLNTGTDYFLFGEFHQGVSGELVALSLTGDGGDEGYVLDTETGNYVVTERKIHSHFSTKLFDFGYPSRIKRIFSVYVFAGSSEDALVYPEYLSNFGEYRDGTCITIPNGDVSNAAFLNCRVLSPNGRALAFGFKLSSNDPITYGGFEIRACVEGRTR